MAYICHLAVICISKNSGPLKVIRTHEVKKKENLNFLLYCCALSYVSLLVNNDNR